MVKLSQQIQQSEVQDRTTRTQRIAQKQEFEKEKRTFTDLKTQATKKQKEFEEISTIDEYEQKYNLLDPSLKQFFQTPTTLRTEKSERIDTTRLNIQEKHTYADQKLIDAKIRFDEQMQYAKDRYQKDKQRGRAGAREDFNKRKNDYEDQFEEREAKWKGYKKGLNKGVQELNQNKDISFNDIEGYASDLGYYEESKEEAKNKNKKFERNQEFERKKLEEAGYKPQVIEKSFKGKPTGVQIGFYNPTTKDWVSGAEFDVKAPVDVSGLKKLGYSTPQQRKIQFGGKTYEFQSRVGIYKTPSGEIVTPYERTGVTEAQLIKEQQDVAFEEWKEKPKPAYVPFKIIKSKDLPSGYGGQQTISTEDKGVLISEEKYYRDIKGFNSGIGKITKKAGEGFDWVKQRVHWDFSIGKSPIAPISLLKFGKVKDPTLVEKAYGDAFKDIETGSQKLEEWVVGKKRIEKFDTGIKEKYQTEYQTKFERKYMEDLIYEKKTFKEATGEFEGTKEAKLLQKKYAKEYGEGYRELQTGRGFRKGTVAGGLGQTGLSLSKFWLKATGDPASATITTIAVGSGLKALKTIPPIVSTGLTVGLGVYGGVKLFDPSSTYIEKGGGLLTLSIAGVSLGYGAYRYLRSPVVKPIKIKAPKQTLKSSEVIGKDVRIIAEKGAKEIVLFENQKLSQIARAGRRTVVTTKGRELIAKYTKLKPAPIYRGVPTEQLGTIKYYEKFGGLIKIGKQSGYQKAFTKLTKYGYTQSQAKATLRYIAPRITEQYLEKGFLVVKKTKAIGEFKYLTKRPVIDVDKSLGIKTRGGKTIRDVYDVERKLITIEKGMKVNRYILEQKTRIGFSLKGGKLHKFTKADFSGGIGVSKATKELKGYEYLGKDVSGLDIFKDAKYKDIYSISASKKIFPADKIVIDASKTKLINKILDLRGKGYAYVKPTNIKKTPFPSSDVSKIINKLDDIGLKGSPTAKAGRYKHTIGSLDPQTNRQLQQQLRVVVNPDPLKAFKLKDLIKVKQFDVLAKTGIAQLVAIKTATGIKTSPKLKTELKARNDLKALLKEDLGLKIKTTQLPVLKTSPALKSQLKAILDIQPITQSPITKTPIRNYPIIPKVITPRITPIVLPFLEAKILKKSKVMPINAKSIQAYLPDFTSRALGLGAETITEKQARKKLKKLLTGLEIRRGVKVKW